MKKKLRIASLIMLVIAVIFVYCALACPTLGRVFYIGNFRFGAEQARICYAVYAVIMVLLFIASFFVRGNQKE